MKANYKSRGIFILLISLLITSCSSNEKKGIEAATEFCEILNKEKSEEMIKEINSLETKYKEFSDNEDFMRSFIDNIGCLDGKEWTLTAETTVSGPIGSYLEIPSGDYKITYEKLNLKLKFPVLKTNYYYADNLDYTIGEVNFNDESGAPVKKEKLYSGNPTEKVIKSDVGTKDWVEVGLSSNGYVGSRIKLTDITEELKSVIQFKSFSLYVEGNDKKGLSNDINFDTSDGMNDSYDDEGDGWEGEEYTESNSSSSSSNNYDELLTSYEKFIDDYIKIVKKAKNGDMTAIMEMSTMMEKANDLGQKMQNAQGNLTSSQLTKFMKLQEKLSKAALEM